MDNYKGVQVRLKTCTLQTSNGMHGSTLQLSLTFLYFCVSILSTTCNFVVSTKCIVYDQIPVCRVGYVVPLMICARRKINSYYLVITCKVKESSNPQPAQFIDRSYSQRKLHCYLRMQTTLSEYVSGPNKNFSKHTEFPEKF